jgi:hypothetical protein
VELTELNREWEQPLEERMAKLRIEKEEAQKKVETRFEDFFFFIYVTLCKKYHTIIYSVIYNSTHKFLLRVLEMPTATKNFHAWWNICANLFMFIVLLLVCQGEEGQREHGQDEPVDFRIPQAAEAEGSRSREARGKEAETVARGQGILWLLR